MTPIYKDNTPDCSNGNTKRTVAITTLGCRANQYDSTAIGNLAEKGDLSLVDFRDVADVYIINTCTVTNSTDGQGRQAIRRARRSNPEATVIVTGCYAEVAPGEVAGIDGVDYVLGNGEKERGKIEEYIFKGRSSASLAGAGGEVLVEGISKDDKLTLRAVDGGGRTRGHLKIQDGCNKTCTFCIIPEARGPSRSVDLETIDREIRAFTAKGYKELVLTGIHIGAYGRDLYREGRENGKGRRASIEELLRSLASSDYGCRFRISSLDPDEVTGEMIGIIGGSKKICNHLHLPLQSGSDRILRAMHRPYSGRLFADLVGRITDEIPRISIGTDIIVGFPGESSKDFEETYNLIESLPLSYLHVFPYSVRRGTKAEKFEGHLPPEVIKERTSRLRELDLKKRSDFFALNNGGVEEVLIERAKDKEAGIYRGHTDNYIPVVADLSALAMEEAAGGFENTVIPLKLSSLGDKEMRGLPC